MMGKLGVSPDLRGEIYENIIINVVWVVDYSLVKLRQMKCPGQLLPLACVRYLFNYNIKEGILLWNLKGLMSNELHHQEESFWRETYQLMSLTWDRKSVV